MSEHLIGVLSDGSRILSSQPNTLRPHQVKQIAEVFRALAPYRTDPVYYRVGWDEKGWYDRDGEFYPWQA